VLSALAKSSRKAIENRPVSIYWESSRLVAELLSITLSVQPRIQMVSPIPG
jgi:hypothetical protein